MRLVLLHPVTPQGMSASLLGGPGRIARYRPGIGCTLEFGDDDSSDEHKSPLAKRGKGVLHPQNRVLFREREGIEITSRAMGSAR